ncbi:unnamed protein product, partial [Closterium sp. Yama58-4]
MWSLLRLYASKRVTNIARLCYPCANLHARAFRWSVGYPASPRMATYAGLPDARSIAIPGLGSDGGLRQRALPSPCRARPRTSVSPRPVAAKPRRSLKPAAQSSCANGGYGRLAATGAGNLCNFPASIIRPTLSPSQPFPPSSLPLPLSSSPMPHAYTLRSGLIFVLAHPRFSPRLRASPPHQSTGAPCGQRRSERRLVRPRAAGGRAGGPRARGRAGAGETAWRGEGAHRKASGSADSGSGSDKETGRGERSRDGDESEENAHVDNALHDLPASWHWLAGWWARVGVQLSRMRSQWGRLVFGPAAEERIWSVPWQGDTIFQVMFLWFLAFWLIGSWLVPLLAQALGLRRAAMSLRAHALYSLLTDLAEMTVGIAILNRCLTRFQPLPPHWFPVHLSGRWYLQALLACSFFPFVQLLSKLNLQLLPLPLKFQATTHLEQSIHSHDPIATLLYAIAVAVCAPVWEEVVFRGFLLPSLTRYFPLWASVVVTLRFLFCAALVCAPLLAPASAAPGGVRWRDVDVGELGIMPSPLFSFDRAPPLIEGAPLPRLGEIGEGAAGEDAGGEAAVTAWLAEQGAQGIGGPDAAVGVEPPKPVACPHPSQESPVSTTGATLVAQQPIAAAAAALVVPAALQQTADGLAEGEAKQLPYNVTRKEKPWTAASVLAAWLLRERAKGGKSKWAPFIRTLPRYAPLPALFDRDVVELFDYPPMMRRLALYRAAFEEEYLRSKAKAMARASKSHFFWALSLVLARALPLLPYTTMPHGLLPSQLPATAASASPVGKVVTAVRAKERGDHKEHTPTAPAADGAAGAAGATSEAGAGSAGSREEFCPASAGAGEGAASAQGCSAVQQQWVGTSAEELARSMQWVEQWMGAGAGHGRRSRFSAPLLLLALPAGFIHSHEPNVQLEWQHNTPRGAHGPSDSVPPVTIRALSAIRATTPLALNLGPLSNDDLWALHGHLPASNPHDRVPLFHTPDSLLAFLLSLHPLATAGSTTTHSSSGAASQWYDPGVSKEQEAALAAAVEAAEDAVHAEVMARTASSTGTAGAQQQYPVALSLWDEVDGGAYNAGADGHVEPRLVAALAAVWFKWTHSQ